MKAPWSGDLKSGYNRFILADVEGLLALKTWWASIFVLPVANRLVTLAANRSNISPNQITILSLFFRLGSGLAFLGTTRTGLAAGAVCYYLAYVFDCVDGPVARLTGRTSEFGRYFDHISDLFGDIFILCCLAFGQGLLFSAVLLAMVFGHLVEYYVSFLAGSVIKNSDHQKLKSTNLMVLALQKYREFFFSRNFKSFLSFPDYEAMVFIFFPLIGMPGKGLKIGFFLLILIVSYTIFSTFITILEGGDKFP
ncbi:MAG: CDP-alcohol phosphatidyltransferase family protein [Desulfatiglandaceae bacterium]|jgi:phosphatidylglycerophosphate synthase